MHICINTVHSPCDYKAIYYIVCSQLLICSDSYFSTSYIATCMAKGSTKVFITIATIHHLFLLSDFHTYSGTYNIGY